ncbi:metallophosphoesterase [Candidatus Neomarinimicrobiota bacterium]
MTINIMPTHPSRSKSSGFFLICLTGILFGQVSIYDIQYKVTGGGTYPSPLADSTVDVGGIVSATGYSRGGFFITSSNGGAWNGLWVLENLRRPSIGDSLFIRGLVSEYLGITRITNLVDYQRPSILNPLPAPMPVSAADASSEEAYEGVVVRLRDVTTILSPDPRWRWRAADTSGMCIIGGGFFNLSTTDFPLIDGYPFSSIQGVASGTWYDYQVHPRSIDDLQSAPDAYVLLLNEKTVHDQSDFTFPVRLALLNQTGQVSSYEIAVQYDPEIVQYTGFDQTGTLSAADTVTDQSIDGQVICSYTGEFSFSGIEELLKLNFLPLKNDTTVLEFTTANLNGSEITYRTSGQIIVDISTQDIGDTLTVIQRPLLNIPSIVVPGQELEIICLAPESTVDWEAELIHPSLNIPLSITSAQYDGNLQRWYLSALIPEPGLYELFDLKVTASGGLEDITRHSVQLIRQYKDSYYFVHISDTHLPTTYYVYEPESLTDSSSMIDFRAVIDDINLIRPEFVLLTGDVIHEGELEDYQERRYYTKAQRILAELEVPVYVVAGNHDIGGWYDTPPPQGTARRDWWRFFGWPWLIDPPANDPLRTQNYSFDYGPVHYVGLEAYINYDNYRYDIYGNDSFTSTQISWLQNNLFYANQSTSKVLFYHKDFSGQLNLSSLDVDMALWGHDHRNAGDINASPYNLSTDAVCNGERTFRLIRVEDGVLHPSNTNYAGGSGNNLSVTYTPSNSGQADTVTAEVINHHPQAFEHGLLKFIMPNKGFGFAVENGVLDQVVRSDSTAICYVTVQVPFYNTINVRIKTDTTLAIQGDGIIHGFALRQNYPNPFNPATRIEYSLAKRSEVTLTIYDIRGREVTQLVNGHFDPGNHSTNWDGRTASGEQAPTGIYIARLLVPPTAGAAQGYTDLIKMVLLR